MKKPIAVLLTLCLLAGLLGIAVAEEETAARETLMDRALTIIPPEEDLVIMTDDDLYDIIGINPADCDDYLYLAAADALSGRELIVVIAKDEEAADAAEKMLNSYLESRLRETRNYLPDAYQALSEAQVVREGLMVILSVAAVNPDEVQLFLKTEE